jgi:hypothetical protein
VSTVAASSKEWTLQGALRKKKIVSITGKSENSELKGVQPIPKDYWDLSVTRLAEDTTPDKVKTFLQGKGIDVKETWVFNSRIAGCKTAKVRISIEHKERAKNAEIWPAFAKIHDWIITPKSVKRKNSPDSGKKDAPLPPVVVDGEA